ncbi:hypothetical protein [Algoriphagus sp. CAU 1675]|uniref:hypothetical protein n=1 Tax=Algoriphagus sp. CAU 1675 TaxID=3032597 RepID=UPI0023DAF83F|nr:hypothetical protein [Algoriphagus sp. CAU 1675]MDF2157800.1 hypothetical protein [Algoriphagus sp. CAU 1675]
MNLPYLKPMDLGNVIYILAVIAYFVYQATKKKRAEGEEEYPESQPPQQPQAPSFEDLLREIREAQKPKPAPKPKPVVVQEKAPEPKKTIYKSLEDYDDEISYYKGAFESSQVKAAKTSEGIPTIPTVVPEAYESKPKPKSRYADLLKNPATVKDAVVMKEILDRKYF